MFKEQGFDGEYFEGFYKDGKRHGDGTLQTKYFKFEGKFEYDLPLLSTGTVAHFDENGKHFSK